MKRIKSKVLDILHNYNINDTQISSYITNGPPEFMSAFKRDYDGLSFENMVLLLKDYNGTITHVYRNIIDSE
jgi:hypothetical protein